jgi:hypothetical protein
MSKLNWLGTNLLISSPYYCRNFYYSNSLKRKQPDTSGYLLIVLWHESCVIPFLLPWSEAQSM